MKKVIAHPDYDPATYDNDISLLYFTKEVDLDIYTPACLPTRHSYNGRRALAVGNFMI